MPSSSADPEANGVVSPPQHFTAVQTAGVVIRHLVPVVRVLFFGQSAGQFLLLSVFNIAFSLACIGTIGVAVSEQKRSGARRSSTVALRTWLGLLGGAVLVTLILTTALGWWIVAVAADGRRSLLDISLAWSALTMVIAAVPGLLHQYRADLGSMLSAKELRERDRLNGMVLFVCGILIYMLGSLNLTLTMIGATAVFIVRDLRPDLIRGLIRKSDMQTGKGRRS